ncbi:MAG: lytic transglycosylase domain-containing protein [Actinomycetota bacterium]
MKWGVAICMLVSLGACAPTAGPPTASSPSASPSVVETPAPSAAPSPTPTDEPLTRAERFAARLTEIDRDFNDLLAVWLKSTGGKPRGAKFNELKVLGLRKQKRMRILVRKGELARKVSRQLPTGLRLETERNIKAARELYRLTKPVKPPVHMPTASPEGPKTLLKHYAEAERRFGVPWTILASINLIESRMGRLTGPSSAGALGPMQFMPATWDAYGKGSPFKPYNAIMAAGRYLSASGAPERMRSALWNYNHSDYYVDAVLTYHRQMAHKPRSYHSYYFWQVFVRTTEGDLQLTGPGRVRCSRSALC